jgi:2'-hydroxyisoflavone reductase
VWVDPDFLHAQGVEEWMELPLWLYDEQYRGMLSVDTSPAFAAGLRTRPLEETVRDTLAWALSESPSDFPAGLDREKEQAVLDGWLSKE